MKFSEIQLAELFETYRNIKFFEDKINTELDLYGACSFEWAKRQDYLRMDMRDILREVSGNHDCQNITTLRYVKNTREQK